MAIMRYKILYDEEAAAVIKRRTARYP